MFFLKAGSAFATYLLHSIVGSKAQHARLNVLVLSDTVVTVLVGKWNKKIWYYQLSYFT